jgi:hypothetical protein
MWSAQRIIMAVNHCFLDPSRGTGYHNLLFQIQDFLFVAYIIMVQKYTCITGTPQFSVI